MMQLSLLVFMFLTVAVITTAQRPKPAVRPVAQSLDEKIRAASADFSGKVWIHAKNLDTGREYSYRGDEHVRTASTIKLAIMAETFRQVAQGK